MPETPRTIELKLREMSQLFNSMDPSPFHEKDLDHDAEEFILNWAQEYRPGEPLKLLVHLEKSPEPGSADLIQKAVHHYFNYRAQLSRRELRHLMRQARVSLGIGLAFLAACLLAANSLPEHGLNNIFKEGLTIVGWVAMWRPMQMYLYDWWPVYGDIRIHDKLGRMPVDVKSGD